MIKSKNNSMYLGLIHSPVRGKDGKDCTSSITNMDLHDLARTARTFGIKALYFIHPYPSQLDFARQLIDHWVSGFGSTYNPSRKEAIELILLKPDLSQAIKDIAEREGKTPIIVATSAQAHPNDLSYARFWEVVQRDHPVLLLFGTAWGLTEKILSLCQYKLSPIEGTGDYNHLSIRSAAAIILDRLNAEWQKS
jgi:hypothetical protein